ncbi:unnamed protein product [Sphagnum balticum]
MATEEEFKPLGKGLGSSLHPSAGVRRQDPPSDALVYLAPEYWDERFEEEEHYEWFKDYSHFRDLLLSHVKPTDRVLEVGAGNSHLSEEMYRDGITNITCTDLSPVAVKRMHTRFQEFPGQCMVAAEANMLNLPFEDQSFDVVIEKGAMDVLFVDSGDPWSPKQEVTDRVHSMLAETHRVLTSKGLFISIAFGQPHFRRPMFEAEGFTWTMKYATFGNGFHYFFYYLHKGSKDPLDIKSAIASLDPIQENLDMVHEHMDNEDFLLNLTLVDDDS